MNEVPLHLTHLQFSQLPPSTRAHYSAVLLVLGLAYLFGGIYLRRRRSLQGCWRD